MAINPYESSHLSSEEIAKQQSSHTLSYWKEMRRGFWFGLKWTSLILLPLWILGAVLFAHNAYDVSRITTREEFLEFLLPKLGEFLYGSTGFVMVAVIGGITGASVMTLATLARRRKAAGSASSIAKGTGPDDTI